MLSLWYGLLDLAFPLSCFFAPLCNKQNYVEKNKIAIHFDPIHVTDYFNSDCLYFYVLQAKSYVSAFRKSSLFCPIQRGYPQPNLALDSIVSFILLLEALAPAMHLSVLKLPLKTGTSNIYGGYFLCFA